MNRITTLLTGFFFFYLGTCLGQITIGGGVDTWRDPFNYYYGYGRDASIYTAIEMGTTVTGGTITTLSWYSDLTSGWATAPTVIRLKAVGATVNVTNSTFASNVTGSTTVYSGTPTWANGWNTIDITDFAIAANQNLMVLVECNYTGGGTGTSTGNAYYYTVAGSANCHAYWQQDSSPPTGNTNLTGGRDNFRPNIILGGLVPPQLNCGAATTISCGASVTSGDIAANGGIYSSVSASCGFATPGNEKLYSFTSTLAGTYTLVVTSINSGTESIDYFFKPASSGCANSGWTCIGYGSATGFLTFDLAASTTYYILLDAESTTGIGSHTFEIRCPGPPPANDECTDATSVTSAPGIFSNPGTQNCNNATESQAASLCSGFTSTDAKDVWYSFQTDATGGNATITVSATDVLGDPIVEAFSGTCGGGLTSLGCIDATTSAGTEALSLTGLAANTVYYIRVYGWAGLGFTFTINVAGTALPLELKSFTGKTESSANLLQWETFTEKNVQWHIVERSADGLKWVEIGKKAGQMESQAPVKYEMEDRNPVEKAYYRLRSVDYDGGENLSGSVVLTRAQHHFGILSAFPSPAKDQTTVQFLALDEENLTIHVTDIAGRLVFEQPFAAEKGANEVVLNLSNLESGVYLVSIANATSLTAPVRIVRE